MQTVAANLGWSAALIPVHYLLARSLPESDASFLAFVAILFIWTMLTLAGLILWRRQTVVSKALLGLSVFFFLYTWLPVGQTVWISN
ncbi:hypothetical protein HY374_00845 [Candidatus Berkelbacteria bacterium]|nr:hypothetical protein [Candidatus Berkelbacteria bacterium]